MNEKTNTSTSRNETAARRLGRAWRGVAVATAGLIAGSGLVTWLIAPTAAGWAVAANVIIAAIGAGSAAWMVKKIVSGRPTGVPGAFLVASGLMLLGVVVTGLALVALAHAQPVATILSCLVMGWCWLAADVVLAKRAMDEMLTANQGRTEATSC